MRSWRSTSTHSPSRAPSVPSGRNPAALAFSTTRSVIGRSRHGFPEGRNALRSGAQACTSGHVLKWCLLVAEVSRTLLCSIAPRVEDDLPYCIGNEIAGIAAGDESRAQLGGGDLELRHRAYVQAAGRALVQVADGARAVVDHELPERPLGRRLPTGAVGHDDVGEPEELAPAMPARQAEEGI